MAYVDENTVATALNQYFAGTQIQGVAEQAEDEGVDASVEVTLGGEPTDYDVQVGGGYLVLNQSLYRGDRVFYGSKMLGTFGVEPSDFAKLFALLKAKLVG